MAQTIISSEAQTSARGTLFPATAITRLIATGALGTRFKELHRHGCFRLRQFGNGFSGVGIVGASSNLVGGASTSAPQCDCRQTRRAAFTSPKAAALPIACKEIISAPTPAVANALGNTLNGVTLSDLASNNLVGGTVAGAQTSSPPIAKWCVSGPAMVWRQCDSGQF